MYRTLSALFLSILTLHMAVALPQDAAKIVQPSEGGAPTAQSGRPTPPTQSAPQQPLTNADVLRMVEAKLAPEVIVEKIKSSPCDFDTSPEALRGLKDAGIPDALLLVLVMSPKGNAQPPPPTPPRVPVSVPVGTVVELETAYTFNSQLTRKGDAISFRVVNPVIVGGQVVIEKGATATGLVTKAERGGHWGRAGRIAWMMKEVTAADGSRIPLQFSGRTVGDSKGAKVATQMIIMGGLMWFAAPIALLHGFKRGENAIVPEGKRFDAAVFAPATVQVTARR